MWCGAVRTCMMPTEQGGDFVRSVDYGCMRLVHINAQPVAMMICVCECGENGFLVANAASTVSGVQRVP